MLLELFESFFNPDKKLTVGSTYINYSSLAQRSFRKVFEQRALLVSLLTLSVVGYIVTPSIQIAFETEEETKERKKKMFHSKRIDKYSTGLTNVKNDCFANSTLQALSSSSSLIIYLNIINKFHGDFVNIFKKFENKLNPEIKNFEKLIPLHQELSIFIFKLNSPIVYSTAISIKPFLKTIEKIYNKKISSNQHDAHELLQLIIQTLETEYLNLIKIVTLYKEDLSEVEDESIKDEINECLETLVIPSFPFHGFGISQFTCLSCLQKSTLSKYPFSVISIALPQEHQTTLNDLIYKAESETISDYSCMNCKIKSILEIEKQKESKLSTENPDSTKLDGDNLKRQKFIEQLKSMENFCKINDEIEDEELKNFIDNYEHNGFKTSTLKSTIINHQNLIKLPPIMIFHLSRSIFENNFSTKNRCRVKFDKKLELKVNKRILTEYKMQENVTSLDDEEDDDDVNDNNSSDDDSDSDAVTDDEDSEIDNDHQEKVNELIDSLHSINIENSNNNTLIKNGLTKDYSVIEFKLKSMIRHTGSHYSGHYECYKKKPVYFKTRSKLVNKNPIIVLDYLKVTETRKEEFEELKKSFNENAERIDFEFYNTNKLALFKNLEVPVAMVDINGNELEMADLENTAKPHEKTSTESEARESDDEGDDENDDDEEDEEEAQSDAATDFGEHDIIQEGEISAVTSPRMKPNYLGSSIKKGLRRLSRNSSSNTSLSSMGSANFNVFNNPEAYETSSVDSGNSGKTRSRKGSVTLSRTSSLSRASSLGSKRFTGGKTEVKLSSVMKKPYWKMSDSEVTEVTEQLVMNDNTAVYMLFYERR